MKGPAPEPWEVRASTVAVLLVIAGLWLAWVSWRWQR